MQRRKGKKRTIPHCTLTVRGQKGKTREGCKLQYAKRVDHCAAEREGGKKKERVVLRSKKSKGERRVSSRYPSLSNLKKKRKEKGEKKMRCLFRVQHADIE